MIQKKKPQSVDLTQLDLEQIKKKTADLPALIEYAHSVGGFQVIPTEMGSVKNHAMKAMKGQTQERLDMILEQMRVLAKQAQEIKDRVQVSEVIYHAELSFKPVMGEQYYLYRNDKNQSRVSMVSPEEWGKSCPLGICLAKVEYMHDSTWKVVERFED